MVGIESLVRGIDILNFTASELTIVKECIRADILSLIEKQTHETIKSNDQLSTFEIVSELHKQIAIRIEIIRKLEQDWMSAYVDGR
jgi:uncharacterized iron-regulated protein